MTSEEEKQNDSIEENIFNGETSLSETEINYSDSSTIVDEYFVTDELEEKHYLPHIKDRLRPRKRTKNNNCVIKPVISSCSACQTQNSLSISGLAGSARRGKLKNKSLSSDITGASYRRKAMLGKLTLPKMCENSTSSPATEKKLVLTGRKKSRKNKATKSSCEFEDGKNISVASTTSHSLLHSFPFHLETAKTRTKSFERSKFLKNFRQTRAKYQRMGLKKLGLNYRRKAMLCKIALPILCVKKRFPSLQRSKKHSRRGRWKRRRKYGKNKPRFSKNEHYRINSNSSNGLLTESSFETSNINIPRACTPRSGSGWRNHGNRIAKSSILRKELLRASSRNVNVNEPSGLHSSNSNVNEFFMAGSSNSNANELFRANSSNSNALFKESNIDTESNSTPRAFTSQLRHGWRSKKNRATTSSILRKELFKSNYNSLTPKSNADIENTNSSQDCPTQPNYNFNERKMEMSYQETLRNKKVADWNIKSENPVKTRYKGQRIATYNEDTDCDWAVNYDSDGSDTLTYCSNTSEETSILYYSEETEISSDTQSLSTRGSKDDSENGDSQLQNNEALTTAEQVQTRSMKQTNTVYENVDIYCNNAMMCDIGSS